MIIHSAEYFIALRDEMLRLKSHIQGQPYGPHVLFLLDGIKREVDLIDMIGKNVSCMNCANRKGTVSPEGKLSEDSHCAINGRFPDNFKLAEYQCGAWIWEDVPF